MKWEDPPSPAHRIVSDNDIQELRDNPGKWGLLAQRAKKFTVHNLKTTFDDIEFVQRRVGKQYKLFGRAKKHMTASDVIAMANSPNPIKDAPIPGVEQVAKRALEIVQEQGIELPPAKVKRKRTPSRTSKQTERSEKGSDFVEAVLDVLQDADEPLTPKEIEQAMEAHGWEGTASTPLYGRVYNTLANQGRKGVTRGIGQPDGSMRWVLAKRNRFERKP